MVVLDTPQDIILYIASTPIQYHSGRIIRLLDNSYFWDKLVKSSHKDMNLIIGPMKRQ